MRVALTYDDGPSEWTSGILDALEEFNAVASFYVLGKYIDGPKTEAVLQRMVRIGCEVGPHGYDHTNLKSVPEVAAQLQLAMCAQRIEAALPGYEMKTWRAPHHSRTPATEQIAFEAEGLTYAGTNNDPGDWYVERADEIARRVMTELRDGSIVNLHDGVPPTPSEKCTTDRLPTVTATWILLNAFRAEGVQTVTAAAILGA